MNASSEQSARDADVAAPAPTQALDADALLALVTELATELRGSGAPLTATLDSDLGRDFGLDSLARMELFARLERAAGVTLSDRALIEAETPRDLLRAVSSAHASPPGAAGVPVAAPRPVSATSARTISPASDTATDTPSPPQAVALPPDAETLVDALAWRATHTPDRVHVRLIHTPEEEEIEITYGALHAGARRIALGLARRGLAPGEVVAIMLPTGPDYLHTFCGVQLAGGIPLPIYPPARLAQLEDHLRRHERILANADAKWLITFEEAHQLSRLLAMRAGIHCRLATIDELTQGTHAEAGEEEGVVPPGEDHALLGRPAPDDIAFLQYTSGSTGQPKGVVLTHRDVLASLDAMARGAQATTGDVFVSWLPLYHDMGLIGAWLGSLVYAMPLVLMSPLTFLARPARWLHAIHRHGGTLSAGPNFAYELCARRIGDEELEGLDLSRWRLAFNGAEAIHADTLEAFAARFARHGFRREALMPVYGLAEATLGVTFTPPGRGPRIERVARGTMERERRAIPIDPDEGEGDNDMLTFVSSGVPLPGFEVRTVDEAGRETTERTEGRLQFRGPSTTSGYFRHPEASAALFDGDWLESGDLAYIANGETFITGRVKEIIIRAGRNLHPYDFEQVAGEIEGVRRGCVALFAAPGAGGVERLVLVAETRETDPARRAELHAALLHLGEARFEQPPDEIVLAPPHTVLKTSSGKIRRQALAELHAAGKLLPRHSSPSWWRVRFDLARLALEGLPALVRSTWTRARDFAFAARVWTVIGMLAAVMWPLAVAARGLRSPRMGLAGMRVAARAFFPLAGVPLTVEREAGAVVAAGPAARVFVANHASYLDGLVLLAACPVPVRFVAKAELRAHPLARWFLEGIGVLFVDRFDTARSVAHAHELTDALRAGASVALFPEGTLHRMPGLLPFQMGAFVAAGEAGVAVAPMVVRGTRSLMRDGTWFPRRVPVRVRMGMARRAGDEEPAAEAAGASLETSSAGTPESAWSRSVRLRDTVRAWMLAGCGEPDLAHRHNAVRDLAA